MNKILIVANLKSYKNINEAKEWLENFRQIKQMESALGNKEVIVCPSFQLLFMFKEYKDANNMPIMLGAQNVSPFDEGSIHG